MIPTPQQAYELLEQYNSDPFHLAHGRHVGETLRWFAEDMDTPTRRTSAGRGHPARP